MRAKILASLASFVALGAFVGLAAIAVAPLGACTDSTTPVLCKDIPDGGCPLSHGVACEDPACVAAYACNAGTWTLDHVCAPRDAAIGDAGNDADARAHIPRDGAFDAPPGANGGPGCTDLQPPECTLGLALACPNDQCCGCDDLFVCADGGWNAWGTCSDDGGIVPR